MLGAWETVANTEILDYSKKTKNRRSVLRRGKKKDFLRPRRLDKGLLLFRKPLTWLELRTHLHRGELHIYGLILLCFTNCFELFPLQSKLLYLLLV